MIEKVNKKQKKRQKIEEKILEGSLGDPKKQAVVPTIKVQYKGIPKIITKIFEDQTNSQKRVILTKGKKLSVLQQLIKEALQKVKILEVIGQNVEIPKAISLVEIIKRQFQEQKQKYKQQNTLGKNEAEQPCIKILITLE